MERYFDNTALFTGQAGVMVSAPATSSNNNLYWIIGGLVVMSVFAVVLFKSGKDRNNKGLAQKKTEEENQDIL